MTHNQSCPVCDEALAAGNLCYECRYGDSSGHLLTKVRRRTMRFRDEWENRRARKRRSRQERGDKSFRLQPV